MSTTASTLNAPAALVRQLLEWLAAAPRSYADTLDAWRTSCPRLPVWEDAVDLGYIDVSPGAGPPSGARTVTLSPRGRAALAAGRVG